MASKAYIIYRLYFFILIYYCFWSKLDFSPLFAFCPFLCHIMEIEILKALSIYNDQFENVCVRTKQGREKRGAHNTDGQKWCLSKHVIRREWVFALLCDM